MKYKGINKELLTQMFPFPTDNIILMGYRGSMAHGTYIPNHIDDKDIWAIVIPPIDYTWGLKHYDNTQIQREDLDLVAYDIRKYFRLLIKSNPNVISWLWLKSNCYLKMNVLGERLIHNRHIFLSKQCYKTFGGYANAQLHRMTHFAREGYMGKKRKALVEEYGYDCKNAAHLIRLLRMGIEILRTGKVIVYRYDDRETLMDIKQGYWSLNKVKKHAKMLFTELKIAHLESQLPEKPNIKHINKLLVKTMSDFYVGHSVPC